MKKLIAFGVICTTIFGMMGCSNSSDKGTKEEATSVSSITKTVQLQGKEVVSIEFQNKKTDVVKRFTDESMIQKVADSLDHAKKKDNIFLNTEALDAINAVMTVKYKDGEKQQYFVWLEGNNEQVMFVKSTSEQYGTGYEANGKDAKNIIGLLN